VTHAVCETILLSGCNIRLRPQFEPQVLGNAMGQSGRELLFADSGWLAEDGTSHVTHHTSHITRHTLYTSHLTHHPPPDANPSLCLLRRMALDPNYFLPLMAFNTRTLLALAHDDMQVTGACAVIRCVRIQPLNPEP
jgi:hypothetical protein